MNKAELVAEVSRRTELSKADAERAVSAFTDTVADALSAGSEVSVPGFGKFSVSERQAREGRNPQTGETMQIAASKSAKFSAASALKQKLNG